MIDIDKQLDELKMEQDVNFDEVVDGIIRKKMRKIAMSTVIAVLVVLVLIFAALNPILNTTNPKLDKLCKGETGGELREIFDTYCESTMPYVDVSDVEVDKKGFGKYEIDLSLMDMRASGTWAYAELEMTRGLLEITDNGDGSLVHYASRFQTKDDYRESGLTDEEYEEAVQEDMEYLEKLPESAYIYASVDDQEMRSLTELIDMNNDDFSIVWAQVYQPDCREDDGVGMPAGISLSKQCASDDSDYRESLSDQELRDVYVKNLKLLVKYPDVWGDLEFTSGGPIIYSEDGAMDMLEEMIADAEKKDKLTSHRYSVYGSKEEVLDFLKEHKINHIFVERVKPTIYDWN